MSSGESTTTEISAISSQLGIDTKLKPHEAEQWEKNLIGNFVLQLYHRGIVTLQNNWMIDKSESRKEFGNFTTAELKQKLRKLNGTDNIGTLLHRCGFIINTLRGSSFYKINSLALYEFRNRKLKEQDEWRLNYDVNNIKNQTSEQQKDNDLINLVNKQAKFVLEEKFEFEIEKDEPKNLLEYQGTTKQERQLNYFPTNMSCSICQEDFSAMDRYEEHIQKHNNITEFEYLNTMSKQTSPIFNIFYRLCKNSHYFRFDIETKSVNLIIEKIIIVQSRSLYYVHNMRVPYSMPESGCEQFFVDSHLFTKYVEQPIVLICHFKDCHTTRIIEEHHFMRCEEFPKILFAINSYRLPDKKKFEKIVELADYFPPKEIQDALKDDFYNEKLMRVSNEFRDYVRNENKLQPQTIGPSLNILLQIEDLDTLKQYFNLTQRGVKLRCFGNEYSFQLRPKQRMFIENILTVFDELILTTRSNISTKPEDLIQLMLQNKDDILCMDDTFVGQIEDVNSSRISFKCYEKQKLDLKTTYTVICRPSRLNIRYQYRSLEMLPINMHFLKNFLFPAHIVPRPLSTIRLTLYNISIGSNPEQLQTVRNIAEGPRNDATYIIFGPPGTGKTTTVVESILQVLKRSGTKVLVTASSNSACDEVAIRLCKQLRQLNMRRSIVRIYSRSSESRIDTIDDELLENSNMYNGQFYPNIEILHEYRIVVCTLSIVAKLATGKFGRGTLYTHVFVDEVAATMEVEALIAVTAILKPESSLIIAGDHKQLGPILQSKRAQELGLGASLMDRLMARECYRVNTDTGDYDRTIQTRLRLNFRSHPAIVNLYNVMYYNHSLETRANIDDVSLVNRWHMAQNKEYPIIFHCVDAPSYNDNQSKSLYNQVELNVVMDYVKDLMYFGVNNEPVKETDIGIISPYKKQYKCIQEELNLRKWFKIETGSVETFQGKEKNIIIVSFVRSGTPTLGFLENPRRLNVTISRAKSLLIMVGNPKTLSLNSDFEYIIKECRRNNTLIGSLTNSTVSRNEHFKRLSTSAETLRYNRNTNNSEMKQKDNSNFRQQRNSNTKSTAADMTQMSTVNDLMQQLDVTNPKDNANERRSRNRGNRGGRRRHNNQNNNKNNIGDGSDGGGDSDGENKPSSTGAGFKQNNPNSKTIKTHHSTTTRGQGGYSGKISKQYNKGKGNNNKQQQKCEIESMFHDLPQVPKITSTNILNPKETVNVASAAQITQKNVTQMTPMQHHYQQYPSNVQHFNEPMLVQMGLPLIYNNTGLPLIYNQLTPNYMQHQNSQHNYMQQQQLAFVNNPSLNFPQNNFQKNMTRQSANNAKQYNDPRMNLNLKPSITDSKSNNTQKPITSAIYNDTTFANTNSSTCNAGTKFENAAKISTTSISSNNTTSNTVNKTTSAQKNSSAVSSTLSNTQKPITSAIYKNTTFANTNSSTCNAGTKFENAAKISTTSISSNNTTSNTVNKTTSAQKNSSAVSSSLSNVNITTSTLRNATKISGYATTSSKVTSQIASKPTATSSSVNATVSNNNRPLTATSSSINRRQLSSVRPAAQTTNSASHFSYYNGSSNLSSTEEIREFPISKQNTSTIATASVRPVLRQTSTVTPTTVVGTSAFSTNNFQTNNNFFDFYNGQTRVSSTTRRNTTSTPTNTIETSSTSSATTSCSTSNSRTNNNNNFFNSITRPEIGPYEFRPSDKQISKQTDKNNSCSVS